MVRSTCRVKESAGRSQKRENEQEQKRQKLRNQWLTRLLSELRSKHYDTPCGKQKLQVWRESKTDPWCVRHAERSEECVALESMVEKSVILTVSTGW